LAQREMLNRLRNSSDKLTAAMDRLTESEDICKKIDGQLKDMEGKEIDSLRKSTRKIQDSIKAIREFINGKPQEKQGYGTMPQITVMNQLQTASQYISSKPLVPGAQELQLVERAEGLIAEALKRINSFTGGKWMEYRKQVEATPVKLFKEYEPIK
jgi:septal ring factor EnvC (AmiA/AmiB activator)